MTEDSSRQAVQSLVDLGHEAMLEHQSITFKMTTDRGVLAEVTRHRVASFAVESTRYCNYSRDKFDNHVTFVQPVWAERDYTNHGAYEQLKQNVMCPECADPFDVWFWSCLSSERDYLRLFQLGWPAQYARDVLNQSLKCDIIMTMNFRETRHFFKLRALGTTGTPHPQMQDLATKMLLQTAKQIPIVFDDLVNSSQNIQYTKEHKLQTKYVGRVELPTE